jgi:hypothetical protein
MQANSFLELKQLFEKKHLHYAFPIADSVSKQPDEELIELITKNS